MRLITICAAATVLLGCGEADSADGPAPDEPMVDAAQTTSDEGQPPAPESNHVWTTDYEKSSVIFRAVQEGKEFEGRFEKFEIAIQLNPDDTSDAKIHAIIDLASVEAGDADRNKSLPTRDWFKTKSFPTAEFVSTEITNEGDGDYIALGSLTIKGVSNVISLPFNLSIEGDIATASGAATLNRTDYKIGEGAFADDKWVGYDVGVTINVVAAR